MIIRLLAAAPLLIASDILRSIGSQIAGTNILREEP